MSYRADRLWWAYVLGAMAVIAIAVAVLASAIAQVVQNGASANALGLIGIAAFNVLIALAYVLNAIQSRKWWRQRRQAIDGDIWMVPESTTMPDVTDVFDVSREQLTLPWRVAAPFIYLVITYGALCVNGSMLLVFMLVPLAKRIWSPSADSLLGAILDFASHQAVLILLPWMFIGFIVSLLLRNRLTIIEATNDGICFQPIVGRVRLMRWEHMRLLEVGERERTIAGESKRVTRWYALYDARSRMISWVEWGWRADMVQPYGISWDDMWALSRELVDVIYQRTGLVPRTFSKSLQRGLAGGRVRTSWEPEEAQEMEVEDARS